MLTMDVIELDQAELAEPIMCALKKDGTFRFHVDYCRLIAVALQDFYPILSIIESIDSLCDARIFSTIYANNDYWQGEVANEDHDKNAFASQHRLFRFILSYLA